MNGFGAKLVNCLSKRFTIELNDPIEELTFKQTWTAGMSLVGPAESRPFKSGALKPDDLVTKIIFEPEMTSFNKDNDVT
jgi:DNA gyrase/topoisomerase IV subunit B